MLIGSKALIFQLYQKEDKLLYDYFGGVPTFYKVLANNVRKGSMRMLRKKKQIVRHYHQWLQIIFLPKKINQEKQIKYMTTINKRTAEIARL